MGGKSWTGWAVLIALGATVGVLCLRDNHAPRPRAFASTISFDDARAEGVRVERPVLALVTADWCGPCRSFKRGALADADVSSAILDKTVPVYLDVTEPDGPGSAAAAKLGVSAIPTLVVIRPDGRFESRTGEQRCDELLAWLDSVIATPTPTGG